jgi:hypothetical protein
MTSELGAVSICDDIVRVVMEVAVEGEVFDGSVILR